MASTAGYMQMGSEPVARRAPAMAVCASGLSTSDHAHAAWHLGALKPAIRMFTVPDTNRTRRPRGLT